MTVRSPGYAMGGTPTASCRGNVDVRCMLRRLAVLSLAAVAAAPRAVAQGSGSIRGTVIRSDGGIRLGGVAVAVIGTGIATSTRPDGQYFLSDVPTGRQSL